MPNEGLTATHGPLKPLRPSVRCLGCLRQMLSLLPPKEPLLSSCMPVVAAGCRLPASDVQNPRMSWVVCMWLQLAASLMTPS